MTKRIISLIFALILGFSCFGLTVFAENEDVYFSNGYATLYYNGVEYSRFDASFVEFDYASESYGIKVPNNPEVAAVDLDFNAQKNIISANIQFHDNSNYMGFYIENSYLDKCDTSNIDYDNLTIDFGYPAGNKIATTKHELSGWRTSLEYSKNMFYTTYEVMSYNADQSFRFNVGALIVVNDSEYYYADYKDLRLKSPYISLEDYDALSVAKITDEELCGKIEAAVAKYNDDITFFNDNITEDFGFASLIFVFCVIPFAAFVLCLALSIRAKQAAYKKIFTTIYIISTAELVVFAILALAPTLFK